MKTRRSWVAIALLLLMFAGPIGVASAAPADTGPKPPPKCFVQKNFELPTCSYANGQWTVEYPDDGGFDPGGSGPGIPAGFVALMILIALIGLGATIWRVSTVRRLARDAGMDPDTATAVTLVGNPGLDATYLAANLRGQPSGAPSASEESAEERLTELKSLLDKSLITQAEYDARRKAVIDGL
ncbi:MAG TPA: SHOCT domain-containing protein [Mycobacteriales bacterium]|nr:SHOCT domain-containing protein [Mycobacteriales bacterium]